MSRLVNYEVASLKRQITRYQQQQKVTLPHPLSPSFSLILSPFALSLHSFAKQESARKANDSQTNARSLRIKFEEQCQEFGIEVCEILRLCTLSLCIVNIVHALIEHLASIIVINFV